MEKECKKKYDFFIKNNIIKCNSKELLCNNPKLIIESKNQEIYRLENVQSLYLYPLTVLDYIDNLKEKKIINLSIIEIDNKIDYKKMFKNDKFKHLKSVELLIKDSYKAEEFYKISEIIEYLYKKNIYISFNIKNLIKIPETVKDYYKYISYFKIFLPYTFDNNNYIEFLNQLSVINKSIQENALVHIKTYLNIEKAKEYEKMLNNFSDLNVDIFQVSKELIPLGKNNIKVQNNIQRLIRTLETNYNNYEKTKFISVKNISTLYYPRFELDERNSRNCYVCNMKPYLYKDKLLPCKVGKIFENIDEWSSEYYNTEKYFSIIEKCGKSCDDCASIFENDLLNDIENIKKQNKDISIYLKE